MMKTTEGSSEDIIWFFYDSQGQRVGLCRNGTYMYYLYNLQGDVMAIASAGTGQLVATYKYDTWGNCTVDELSGYAIGDLNPFRYRGYFWDEESGMYYLNSRYYSSEFGRFISADSEATLLATPTSISDKNLFAYCDNNPVNRSDEGGAFWHIVVGAFVGAVISGVTKVLSNISEGKKARENLGTALLAGAASGALGATGIGAIGLAVGSSVISAAESTINEYVDYKKSNGKDSIDTASIVVDAIAGGITGAISMGGSGSSYYNWLGEETCIKTAKGFSSGGLSGAISEGKEAMKYYASMTKAHYKDNYGGIKIPKAFASSLYASGASDYMKGQYVY